MTEICTIEIPKVNDSSLSSIGCRNRNKLILNTYKYDKLLYLKSFESIRKKLLPIKLFDLKKKIRRGQRIVSLQCKLV